MEINSVSESLSWKGSLSFSGAYRETGRIRVDGLAGTLRVEGTNTALEVKEGTIHFSQVAAQSGPVLAEWGRPNDGSGIPAPDPLRSPNRGISQADGPR